MRILYIHFLCIQGFFQLILVVVVNRTFDQNQLQLTPANGTEEFGRFQRNSPIITIVRKARFYGLCGTQKEQEELREKWLFLPPKRKVARSNRAGIAKSPCFALNGDESGAHFLWLFLLILVSFYLQSSNKKSFLLIRF